MQAAEQGATQIFLAMKGFQGTGIDLSFNNIREAKKFRHGNLRCYCRDMRIPFGKEYFDYVFNFFTSFGYFKTHFEHNSVIRNMSAALKPGGKLVLDYLHTYYAKRQLVLNEEKEIDGTIFHLWFIASQRTGTNFISFILFINFIIF